MQTEVNVRKVLDDPIMHGENPTFGIVKPPKPNGFGGNPGCGGRTRTYDLRVMSPTSFQLLYSAIWEIAEFPDIISWVEWFVNSEIPRFYGIRNPTFLRKYSGESPGTIRYVPGR